MIYLLHTYFNADHVTVMVRNCECEITPWKQGPKAINVLFLFLPYLCYFYANRHTIKFIPMTKPNYSIVKIVIQTNFKKFTIPQTLANFFSKRPESKYFRL